MQAYERTLGRVRRLGLPSAVFGLALLGMGLGCEDERPASDGKQPSAQASSTQPPSALPEPSAQPAPSQPREPPQPLVIVAGGDVNLGRLAGQLILRDPEYNPLVGLAPVFESGNLRLINLESQLSEQNGETQSTKNNLIFTGPPGGARVLANAGIDLVSVANNHVWDYRKAGFLETLQNLTEAGVGFAGGSKKPGKQYEPYIFKAPGWSVALFAVTHIWNQGPIDEHPGRNHVAWARYDKLSDKLQRAKKEHDLVVLSYHGGGEYLDGPVQATREFVETVMNAGVDLLFGHHPHVVHGVSWFEGSPAFYSLGNLVFSQHKLYPWTGTGFLARVTLTKGAAPRFEACPYRIVGHSPRFFSGRAKEPLERAFRRRLKIVSITVGGTSIGEPAEFSCMELSPPKPKQLTLAGSR